MNGAMRLFGLRIAIRFFTVYSVKLRLVFGSAKSNAPQKVNRDHTPKEEDRKDDPQQDNRWPAPHSRIVTEEELRFNISLARPRSFSTNRCSYLRSFRFTSHAG
jgi:hypothetical protein